MSATCKRTIRVYRYPKGSDAPNWTHLIYKCGKQDVIPDIINISQSRKYKDGSPAAATTSGGNQPQLANQELGGIRWYITSTQSDSQENPLIYDYYLDNVPNTDMEQVYFKHTALKFRAEVLNENGVLICDNGNPLPDGTFPEYSKDYWKNAPTLTADEVQDDPDVFKLICTPNNLLSDSIALYGAVGAGDPELIETRATAASISFNVPIADLDPGTYAFTAVPVKGAASGIASTGVELVIPEPEPEPEPEPDPENP